MASILIVDDDAANRLLLRTVLEYGGYEVREASGGAEALELAQRAAPALAIVDMHMPGMSGSEFVKALRERISPTVVLYTATSRSPMLDDFMQAFGIHHVIPKPSEPQEILRIVEIALQTAK